MGFDENDILKLEILNLYADCKKDIKVGEKEFLQWCLGKIDSGKFVNQKVFFECLIRSNFDLAGIDEVIKVVDESGGKIDMENIAPNCFTVYRGEISTFAEVLDAIVKTFRYDKIYGKLRMEDLRASREGEERPIIKWFLKEMDKSREMLGPKVSEQSDGENEQGDNDEV